MFLKRNYREYFFIFAVLAVSLLFTAGDIYSEQKLKSLSVQEALETARNNNPEYKIAVQKLKAAKEQVNAVWSELMPVLESEASMLRQKAESGFMSLSDGQYDLRIVQLKFGINPGSFYNRLKLSKKSCMAAEQEVKRIKNQISYDVIKSYFNLLIAVEMIKLREDSVSLLKSNLKDVNNLFKTGSVPRFELLQAEVNLKSHEPLLLEARDGYKTALDLFNYHLGSESNLYTVDEGTLDSNRFRLPEGDQEAEVKRLCLLALKHRPEIIQLNIKRDAARHRENVYSSYYLWPTFTIAGNYGKTMLLPNPIDSTITTPMGQMNLDMSQVSGEKEWQTTWQVRVAATYRWSSLFPTDKTSAKEREERTRIKEAEEEISRIVRLIKISIKSGYSNLFTSYWTIMSQKENIKRAEEGLRIARESYRAGVIKNSDLLSAQFSLTQAKTSYINAVNKYYLSIAGLKKEIGIDDEREIFQEKNHE